MRILIIILMAAAFSQSNAEALWTPIEGPVSGMEFVPLPGGYFTIGRDTVDLETFDQSPMRTVMLEPFQIMTTEVTQGMWLKIMGSDRIRIAATWTETMGLGNEYPVYGVSWYDCSDFISRLNSLDTTFIYRLPTESEWEYACRAGTTTPFYWGELEPENYCRFRMGESILAEGSGILEVTELAPNQWGLYDMSGNVSEWCQDRYTTDYDYLPGDGGAFTYPCDDQWPVPLNYKRVRRGGSWLTDLSACMSSTRGFGQPDQWTTGTGFRLVREPRTDEAVSTMLYHQGLDRIDEKATSEGIELFTRALELDPSNKDALIFRGFYLQGEGNTESAIADLERAAAEYPDDPGAWLMLGVVLIDAGYDHRAMDCLEEVTRLDPDYPNLHFHAGIASLLLYDLQTGIDELTAAIRENPGSSNAHFARAYAYLETQQEVRALDDIDRCIELDPYFGDAYMLRSILQKGMGNMEDARADSIMARSLGVQEW